MPNGPSSAIVQIRGVPIPLAQIELLKDEIGGKAELVIDERLNIVLERVLKAKKARHPLMLIKSMRCTYFPAEEFVPVEITLDPFTLGKQFRSGFHIFFKRRRIFSAG